MRSLIFCLCSVLFLSGCFPWLHRPEIQQGNIVEQEQLDRLTVGMNKEQVRFLLGTPVVDDAINSQLWSYYFSFKDTEGVAKSYWVNLEFDSNLYQRYVIGQDLFDIRQSE